MLILPILPAKTAVIGLICNYSRAAYNGARCNKIATQTNKRMNNKQHLTFKHNNNVLKLYISNVYGKDYNIRWQDSPKIYLRSC